MLLPLDRDESYYKILRFWSPLINWRCSLPKDAVVVATNGCFDILHAGHIEMIRRAKEQGDFLVVGLNSDSSIKALKGPNRPINTELNRKLVLEAVRYVDFVHIFHDPRATTFLLAASPHVYVKAGDYSLETMDVDERRVLEKVGASIKFVDMVDGLSTTNTLKALQT